MPQVDWGQIRKEYESTDILLKDLAAKYCLKEGTVRSRKNRENWQRVATQHGNAMQGCNATPDVATPEEEAEPFPGQCTAIGHKSGQRCRRKVMPGSDYCRRHADAIEGQCTARSKQSGERCKNKSVPGKNVCKFHGGKGGCPTGTQNAIKHGFFAKIFPDDEETRALVADIIEKDPLDILWENIMIQYVAIARAQKIMFVKDKDDLTEHLKREKETHGLNSDGWEKEWEMQYAWDKHASFLKAQSQAMQTIERLIQRYDALIQSGHGSEEHRLKLDKLKAQIDNLKAGGDEGDLLDEVLDEEDPQDE